MEIDDVLKEFETIVDRAWYKCDGRSESSGLLLALKSALADTALERRRKREREENQAAVMAEAQKRHDAEEEELRKRMPPLPPVESSQG